MPLTKNTKTNNSFYSLLIFVSSDLIIKDSFKTQKNIPFFDVSMLNTSISNLRLPSDTEKLLEDNIKATFSTIKENNFSFIINLDDIILDFDVYISLNMNDSLALCFFKNTTDTNRLRKKIIDDEQKYQFMVQNSNDIVYQMDKNGVLNFVSPAWERMLGHEAKDVVGRVFTDFIFQDDAEKCISILRNKENIKNALSQQIIYRIAKKDGQIRWHSSSIAPIYQNNELNGFIGTARDVTDNVELQERYLSQEKYLTTLLDTATDGFWVTDQEQRIVECNVSFCKALGYTKEEILNLKLSDIEQNENVEHIYKHMDEIKQNTFDTFETKHKRKNGELIDVEVSVSIMDNDGIKFVCFARYISKRKKVEKELLESQKKFSSFFDLAIDLLCIADIEGNFIKVNKEWGRTLGLPIEKLEHSKFLDFVHPDDLANTLKAVEGLTQQQTVVNFVNRYRVSNGDYHYIEWRSVPQGRYIYAAARDITNRIKMEESLYKEKELFETTLLSISDGIIATDAKGIITSFNKSASKITKYQEKDVLGKDYLSAFNLHYESSKIKCNTAVADVIQSKNAIDFGSAMVLIDSNNKTINIELNISPIIDKLENVIGTIIVFRDYTNKKEKEKEIEYLSYNDFLTGAYNRRYIDKILNDQSVEKKLPILITMIDINGLKKINDALGHQNGDLLIQKSARVLKNSCDEKDIVARYGGDEFIIVSYNKSEEDGLLLKKKIKDNISHESIQNIQLSLAVGCAVKKYPHEDIYDTIKDADEMMYLDKQQSKVKQK